VIINRPSSHKHRFC